ncbi:SDR family NAD(P)-dependent oxidoreductase [Treponema sp. OttesenSCG-928-L16]|nr:SDR family NAD(P)-dependent oxidoreductase [Treponema sp. OttesenSCG-928-L16]
MNKEFFGKEVLIIGGSGGIGAALALRLGQSGASLHIHGGSSRERLDRTVGMVQESGGKASGFLCPADKAGAAERIISMVPPVDILICAWGPFMRRSLEDMSAEEWEALINNNFLFPGTMISLVLRDMINKGWGRILLFGGTNTDTIRGFKTTAAYSAAKTALGVLAKSVAISAGPKGITCNVICPGLTDTEYTDEEGRSYNRRLSPGGIALKAEDIAEFGLQILMNPSVNGAIIPVDKGGRV